MPYYSYSAADSSGRVVRGRLRADSYSDLVNNLREQNLFCSSYKLVSERGPKARYSFKTKHLSLFSRQLASMLTSGISLVRAMYVLMAQETKPSAKKVLLDIYEDLQRGRAFSEALENHPGAFPNLFISMVAAGEASGNLDVITERVADHYANDAKINNTVKKAMTYPIILCVLMLVMVIGMFTFIMPMFMSLFSDPEKIPPLSRALIGMSDFFRTKWYILLVIVVAIVVAVKLLMKTPPVRFAWDRLICRIPKISKLIVTIYTSRFARTMANLFASGLQLVECIEKSVGTLGNKYVSAKFEEVVEDVKKGETLSNAISKIGLFEGIFVSTIYIGEESGRLDEILIKSADYYEEEADAAVQSLVSMLEPVMIIVMGGAIGLILAAIFPMLYGSMEGLGA